MLLPRIPRPFYLLSAARRYSGGHHERILEDYDGQTRRINPVVRHDIWWESQFSHESSVYRDPRWNRLWDEGKENKFYTIALSAFVWAWVMYHFFYEGHELYAKHYPTPDVAVLSDEHLGIPPDEEGLAPTKKWVKTIEVRFATPTLAGYPKALLEDRLGDSGPFKF